MKIKFQTLAKDGVTLSLSRFHRYITLCAHTSCIKEYMTQASKSLGKRNSPWSEKHETLQVQSEKFLPNGLHQVYNSQATFGTSLVFSNVNMYANNLFPKFPKVQSRIQSRHFVSIIHSSGITRVHLSAHAWYQAN